MEEKEQRGSKKEGEGMKRNNDSKGIDKDKEDLFCIVEPESENILQRSCFLEDLVGTAAPHYQREFQLPDELDTSAFIFIDHSPPERKTSLALNFNSSQASSNSPVPRYQESKSLQEGASSQRGYLPGSFGDKFGVLTGN